MDIRMKGVEGPSDEEKEREKEKKRENERVEERKNESSVLGTEKGTYPSSSTVKCQGIPA